MNITLTPEQSQMVQQKLQSSRYQNLDDLLLQAFQLLDDWEEHSLIESPDWIAATRTKVDAAIASIAANGGNDGEAAISQLLDKFRQAREASLMSRYIIADEAIQDL
jgi:antitoxin ParD1/3/4